MVDETTFSVLRTAILGISDEGLVGRSINFGFQMLRRIFLNSALRLVVFTIF